MVRRSENPVLRSLAYLKHNNFVATGYKYGIDNYMMNVKYAVWRNFSNSLLYVCVCNVTSLVFICFCSFLFVIYTTTYYLILHIF